MLDIHPFVIHFAIALLVVSVLFDIIAVSTNRPHFETAGWWNLFLGFFAALFAVITGLYAKNSAFITPDTKTLLTYHQYLGIATAVIFTGLFIWRSGMNRVIQPKWRGLYLSISVLGVVVLLTVGFIGGLMVYEHGANVDPVKSLNQKVKVLEHQLQLDSTAVDTTE